MVVGDTEGRCECCYFVILRRGTDEDTGSGRSRRWLELRRTRGIPQWFHSAIISCDIRHTLLRLPLVHVRVVM